MTGQSGACSAGHRLGREVDELRPQQVKPGGIQTRWKSDAARVAPIARAPRRGGSEEGSTYDGRNRFSI